MNQALGSWIPDDGFTKPLTLNFQFVAETKNLNEPITFYDSVSGKPLFIAPKGRRLERIFTEEYSVYTPNFQL